MTELFRHRFNQVLRDGKHLSARKVADLLSWKHSGFHIQAGDFRRKAGGSGHA